MIPHTTSDYFELFDPLQPNVKWLRRAKKETMVEIIGIQAEDWKMPVPDVCGKTRKQLIDVIFKMAKDANKKL